MDRSHPDRAATSASRDLQASYRFPMTLTQQAFWYLDRVQRGNPAWNIAVRFRLIGPLDSMLMQGALDALVERQDILRTTFHVGGDGLDDDMPVQLVHAYMPVHLQAHDLSHLAGEEKVACEEELTLREAEQSFDLSRGPLLRLHVLRLSHEDHVLLLTIHHIVADGWSIGILARELTALYALLHAGKEPVLEPLPIQFADYAVWKQGQGTGAPEALDRAYWGAKLRSLSRCEIPLDYPRPAISAHKGHILSTLMPEQLAEDLAACARNAGCTLYAAALAALKLLVHRITGSGDIYIGTLLAGRDRVELESLVGVFVNTLVLRTQLAPEMPFATLLAAVRATIEEGVAHQGMPFSQLMTQLRLKPERGCSHFYSINFIFQRDFVKPWQGAGLTVTALPSRSPGAIYDLNFFMVQRAEGWRLSCEYDRELYAPATIALLLEQFLGVLQQVTRKPEMLLAEVELAARTVGVLAHNAPGRYAPMAR